MKKNDPFQSLHITRYNRKPLTVLRSYSLTVFFLSAFFLLPSLAWADNLYYEIKQENSVSQIQTDLQTVINNATDGDNVVVTGSKTDADIMLVLNIPAKKTVLWEATYQSSPGVEIYDLIFFHGEGTFDVAGGTITTANAHAIHAVGKGSVVIVSGNGKVQTSGTVVQSTEEEVHAIFTYGNVEIKDNAQVSGNAGEVIASFGDNAIVSVSGGSITTFSGNAIVTYGKNSKIYISGGYLCNDAINTYPTVIAYDPTPSSEALVHVSGDAVIRAKGDGCAIISSGSVYVGGNAQVSNNTGGNDPYMAAVRASNIVEISDNATISASKNYVIACNNRIIVKANSKILAKNNAIAIFNYGQGQTQANVEVKDKAQIIAENNYAISHNVPYYIFKIDGGVVFAYGNKIHHVINNENFMAPTGLGIVLAWDKDAGNTNYEMFSTDDIFKLPESATAYWDKKEGKHGISYANGENTGFIPIDNVNVLSINENNLPEILVYPNPTSGELRIETSDMRYEILEIEIYDMIGRKFISNLKSQISNQTIDISKFSNGIYLVKIETEKGTLAKKIIKK